MILNPLRAIREIQRKRELEKENTAEIKRKAAIYRQLITDDRYKLVLKGLFEKKVKEKVEAIRYLKADSQDKLLMDFLRLQAELNVFATLIETPDNYFEAMVNMPTEEEIKKAGE